MRGAWWIKSSTKQLESTTSEFSDFQVRDIWGLYSVHKRKSLKYLILISRNLDSFMGLEETVWKHKSFFTKWQKTPTYTWISKLHLQVLWFDLSILLENNCMFEAKLNNLPLYDPWGFWTVEITARSCLKEQVFLKRIRKLLCTSSRAIIAFARAFIQLVTYTWK